MNKFLKIMLSIAGIIAIVGLIFIIVGLSVGAKRGLTWGRNGLEVINSEANKIEDFQLTTYENIEMNIDLGDIEFVESDTFGIEIEYYGSEFMPEYEVNNGTLYINDKGSYSTFNSFFNIDLTFESRNNKIKIYMPKNYDLNNVIIENNCGDININNININKLYIKSDLGDTKVENGEIKELELYVSCGDARLDNILSEKIIIKNSLGRIKGEGIECADTNLKNSCGDIKISGELTGNIELNNDLGDSEIEIIGTQSDYNMDLETSLGDVEVSNQDKGSNFNNQIKALHSIKIRNSCGDIDVNFSK